MRDGDWLIGWGCASAVYPTHIGAATARVQLTADGRAAVQIAAHEIGTGIMTVVGQMAAERLGIPLEQVQVEVGDSIFPPVAGGRRLEPDRELLLGGDEGLRRADGQAQRQRTAKHETVGARRSNSLEDKFERLGVSTLEEYAEFVPPRREAERRHRAVQQPDQEALRGHADAWSAAPRARS